MHSRNPKQQASVDAFRNNGFGSVVPIKPAEPAPSEVDAKAIMPRDLEDTMAGYQIQSAGAFLQQPLEATNLNVRYQNQLPAAQPGGPSSLLGELGSAVANNTAELAQGAQFNNQIASPRPFAL